MSAWCRGTVVAMFATYLVLATLYAGPPLIALLLEHRIYAERFRRALAGSLVPEPLCQSEPLRSPRSLAASWVVASIAVVPGAGAVVDRRAAPWSLAAIPCCASSNASTRSSEQRNAALGWGRSAENLPSDRPVLWHEFRIRRSLANLAVSGAHHAPGDGAAVPGHHLHRREELVFGGPGAAVSRTLLARRGGAAAALLLGASLIASERSQQTLDVLLHHAAARA